jgi:hypothetical protein
MVDRMVRSIQEVDRDRNVDCLYCVHRFDLFKISSFCFVNTRARLFWHLR